MFHSNSSSDVQKQLPHCDNNVNHRHSKNAFKHAHHGTTSQTLGRVRGWKGMGGAEGSGMWWDRMAVASI